MNINALIPAFKRFKTINLGVKRMLFALGIPIVIFLAGATIDGDKTFQGIPFVFLAFFTVIYWIFYWVIIKVILWVYDGFGEK